MIQDVIYGFTSVAWIAIFPASAGVLAYTIDRLMRWREK